MMISRCKILCIVLLCMGFTGHFARAQEGKVTIRQDDRINKLIEIRKTLNKTDEGERRYRIQVYNGTLSGARNAAGGFRARFPDWSCDIRFETPNYKVWVGKFRARLEADRYLEKVKTYYPSAFILLPY